MKTLDDFYKEKAHYVKVQIHGEDVLMLKEDAASAKRAHEKYVNTKCDEEAGQGGTFAFVDDNYYRWSDSSNNWELEYE